MLSFQRTDTAAESGPAGVITQIEQLISQVSSGIDRQQILGIGVGTPGPLDPFDGVVLEAPNLAGWINVPLKAELHKRTGLPVHVGNDANAAALGEWRFGSGRGTRDFVYVTISTGIGGGVITNSQLMLGYKGIAGEVGHMTIQTDGPVCGCGNIGCWEAVASGTALARAAVVALERGHPSLINDIANGTPIEGWHIAAAAQQGDSLAQTLMRREAELMGIGLVNLLHMYAPERVALGGGVTKSMAQLEPIMRATIAERAMPPYRDIPIELATLGDKVGVIGAAALVL
jgi:glucokinase